MISESKTGSYLAGLVGALMVLLMLICAGAYLAGALLRWLTELARGREPVATGSSRWDLGLVITLSVIAILLSNLG